MPEPFDLVDLTEMDDFDYLPLVALISATSALSHGAQRNLALSSMTQTQTTCGDLQEQVRPWGSPTLKCR